MAGQKHTMTGSQLLQLIHHILNFTLTVTVSHLEEIWGQRFSDEFFYLDCFSHFSLLIFSLALTVILEQNTLYDWPEHNPYFESCKPEKEIRLMLQEEIEKCFFLLNFIISPEV